MKLKELSSLLGFESQDEDQEITKIVYDSRQVIAGSVFFACTGVDQDGYMYVNDAFNKGAIA
ncbi:MAG: Mur ligase domain-containing protein, partial [Turicibacter sp.]